MKIRHLHNGIHNHNTIHHTGVVHRLCLISRQLASAHNIVLLAMFVVSGPWANTIWSEERSEYVWDALHLLAVHTHLVHHHSQLSHSEHHSPCE